MDDDNNMDKNVKKVLLLATELLEKHRIIIMVKKY